MNRKGRDVYFGETKLTRVDQATKGPGKEVIKIEGLPGSNGQKWVSLSILKEGENVIETQGREITSSGSYQKYILTPEEKIEVELHQKVIDDIILKAKARYVPPIKILTITELAKMSSTDRKEYADRLDKYLQEVNRDRGE